MTAAPSAVLTPKLEIDLSVKPYTPSTAEFEGTIQGVGNVKSVTIIVEESVTLRSGFKSTKSEGVPVSQDKFVFSATVEYPEIKERKKAVSIAQILAYGENGEETVVRVAPIEIWCSPEVVGKEGSKEEPLIKSGEKVGRSDELVDVVAERDNIYEDRIRQFREHRNQLLGELKDAKKSFEEHNKSCAAALDSINGLQLKVETSLRGMRENSQLILDKENIITELNEKITKTNATIAENHRRSAAANKRKKE